MKNKDDKPAKEDVSKENLKRHRGDSARDEPVPVPDPIIPPPRSKDFGYERCFPAETLIQMVDGSRQPIAAIRVDDRVCCWDWERHSVVSGRVVEVLQACVHHLVRVNGRLAASPSHRIMTTRGYLRFDEIRPG